MVKVHRRKFVAGATAGLALLSAGVRPAMADVKAELEDIVKKFTGGAKTAGGKLGLTTPEIAENGNTVPIAINVDSPMTDSNYVESVMVLADGNPRPHIVTFNFTPLSGEAAAKARVRLSKTQNVIAVAKMSDGSFHRTQNLVKVTIGGCGG